MAQSTVSIGQVKRDVSQLVNRVAYGKERIILTSRGKPKAALVSIEDLQALERIDQGKAQRLASLERARALGERIRAGRPAYDVDSVELLDQLREARTDELLGLR
jgi:prevent-host-death family protein